MLKEKFKLTVPLDASDIRDFKPDRAVKVVLKDSKRQLYSKKVKFDEAGKGTAIFDFAVHPGSLTGFIGPGDAFDEEMLGIQTLTLRVSVRLWFRKQELTLKPIRITPYYYYYWWWYRWCRTFTIRGRVECPDGNPVPAAKVCAYDVDWWFRWSSTQQVGCAVTDIDGSFEITFRWCCGWLPWWWWRLREWRLDPFLADYINKWLFRYPDLNLVPTPYNQPTLAIFNKLLEVEGLDTKRLLAPEGVAKLDKIRPYLLKHLPAAPDLEKLRIWPWYPWRPWQDCTPDIIFKVAQDCKEVGTVIVDENVFDTRWNIPTTLDVTLIANENACCLEEEEEPLPCEDERCMFYTTVCNLPVAEIGGNDGADPSLDPDLAGYYLPNNVTPGDPEYNGDRPFGGIVNVSKNPHDMAAVDYYTIEYNDGSGWKSLPPGAARTIVRYMTYHDGTE